MITRTLENKTYTLVSIQYHLVAGAEHMELIFEIIDGNNTFYKSMIVTPESRESVLQLLDENFADLVIQRLIQENT